MEEGVNLRILLADAGSLDLLFYLPGVLLMGALVGDHAFHEVAQIDTSLFRQLAQQFNELWVLDLSGLAEPRQVGDNEIELRLTNHAEHTNLFEDLGDLDGFEGVRVERIPERAVQFELSP